MPQSRSQFRFSARLAIAAALLTTIGACDRPTAPDTRAVPPAAPATSSGPLTPDGYPLHRSALLDRFVQVLAWNHIYPRDSLTVIVDGREERFIATVIEHVDEPPPSMRGARPYVQRTLMAWNHALNRGIIMTSEDAVATVAFPDFASRADEKKARLWQSLAVVNVTNEDGGDGWTGSEGELRFVDGPHTDSCPEYLDIPKNKTGDGWRYGFGYDDCDRRSYRVSGFGELQKASSSHAATGLARWFTKAESFRIPDQELPGTRIVVRCPAVSVGAIPLRCDLFSFFRAREQFAAQFGGQFSLDLQHLNGTDDLPTAYYQQLVAGRGAGFPLFGGYLGPVKYTVYAPDGTMLETATVASAAHDTLLRNLVVPDPIVRYASRNIFFVAHFGQYQPAIVDLTLLPCANVSDPNRRLDQTTPQPPNPACTPAGKGP